MTSYKELIGFLWRFMRRQKGTFFAILTLDALAMPLAALVWPYLLNLVVDIFTQYEGDRLAAWDSLKGLIIWGLCFMAYIEIASRTMGFLMAKAIPKLQADLRMAMFDHV